MRDTSWTHGVHLLLAAMLTITSCGCESRGSVVPLFEKPDSDWPRIATHVYSKGTSSIGVVSEDGLHVFDATRGADYVVWIRGENAIAYCRSGAICRLSLDDEPTASSTVLCGEAELPALKVDKQIYGLSCSPDGSQIAFHHGDRIYTMDLATRVTKPLGAESAGARSKAAPKGRFPAWSPDGGRVAYMASDDKPPRIIVWDVPGRREASVIPRSYEKGEVWWSSDGKRLVCTSMNTTQTTVGKATVPFSIPGEVRVYDLSKGRSRRLMAESAHVQELAWRPGSDDIALVVGDNLLLVDSNTSRARAIPVSRGAASSPAWSDDGKWLVYSLIEPSGQSRIVLRRMSDGSQWVLTPPNVSCWTPLPEVAHRARD